MVRIESNKGQPCDFWIARVGRLAGKPLREPYTSNNSFAVHSNDPDTDFAKLFCIYQSGIAGQFTGGTCQVAIRIRDVRKLAKMAAEIPLGTATKVAKILRYAENLEAQLKQYKQLARALSYQAIKVKL